MLCSWKCCLQKIPTAGCTRNSAHCCRKLASSHYASPTSGEAYRDRQLTTNFELWVEIFCVPTCFHVRIPNPCLSFRLSVRPSACPSVHLSICPYPEKRNYPGFVNISPTLVIDTSMESSSRVLQHGHGKCEFYKIKVAKVRKISSVKRHFPRLFIGVA